MRKIFGVLAVLLFITGCEQKTKPIVKKDKDKIDVASHPFDADSAFAYVKAQTDFGPRTPESEAHEACANFLMTKLTQFCDTAIVQPFVAKTYDGKRFNSQNIIGSFAPEKENRILLGAHWDSRHIADMDSDPEKRNLPIDGANDGASGVGVLIELARQLQINSPEIGIDIIFFDAEDYGTPSGENIDGDWWCLGSQHWTTHPHRENYRADYGILLDMVGATDAKFSHEGFSIFYASQILSKVWGTANRLGYGNYFINQRANPITDDHYYVNKLAHIPMINIVHQDKNTGTGFFPHWHTQNDNIHIIDKNTLQAVGKVLLEVIYGEQAPENQ
ncbi:M28 family peptidase [Bacteroidales bacterium OttesenSCG-928-B11]|nr:M28 family peptidase [Bacteroidales bacterium OttesenSCG-928-C03]MDL2312150.1 M28 family peptidase [Bacteroidales bacterium OttesenSCG-928-B11]